MGLKLRLNLFKDVEAKDVFGAMVSFYEKHGSSLVEEKTVMANHYELYERKGHWCILSWDSGWEWKLRREAQLYVSKQLNALGLLVFVFDGRYWGYELFKCGEVIDHFVQNDEEGEGDRWFPGQNCDGNPALFAQELNLSPTEIAPFFVRHPNHDPDWLSKLHTPARPNDEFGRFEECAVLDFLRVIGVEMINQEDKVEVCSKAWRIFRTKFQENET